MSEIDLSKAQPKGYEYYSGALYRHMKGSICCIVALAEHSETGEALVVYRNCSLNPRVYARPRKMFEEHIDGIPRFQHICKSCKGKGVVIRHGSRGDSANMPCICQKGNNRSR